MNYERRNTGFTLIELITVIIIIGIMLGVALPKYMKMAEKTKASNAKRVLDILRKAEEAWYAENSAYVTITDGGTSITDPTSSDDDYNFLEEIPKAKIENDPEWDFGVSVTTTNTSFTASAVRKDGRAYANEYITLNSDGDFDYSNDMEKLWK